MTSHDAVKKELVCPICADYFTHPKGLPCLHTFCRECLKSHIMAQTDRRHFSCPMCRSLVPVPENKPRLEWVDLFPTNHQVLSIMDIIVPNHIPKFCKICTETGSKHKAVKHCTICDEDYCRDCARLHRILNATKSHVLCDVCPDQKQKSELASTGKEKDNNPKVDYTINASFKCTVNARTDPDDEPSFITGVLFLEDDRLVAADNSNYKIKLFGNEGKFVTEASQVRPFGLTLLHHSEIAVTEDECIKFFQIHPNKIKMEKRYNTEWKVYTPHTLSVSNSSRGLHYTNGEFVICSGDDLDKHVAIIDVDGTRKRHIWKDENGRGNLFKEPWYCRFGDDLEEMYISDGVGVFGSVKCLSYHGQLQWEYPCQMPRGIATIGEHIFVADWRENEIKVLTKEGEFIKVLLTKEDGINRPQAIAINHSGDKLVVTNSPPYKSDNLLLFDLEYARSAEMNIVPKQTKSLSCSIC